MLENGSNRKVKRSELQNENPNRCPKPRAIKQFCVQSPPSPKKQAQFSSSSQKQALHQSKPEIDSLLTAAFTPYPRSKPELLSFNQSEHALRLLDTPIEAQTSSKPKQLAAAESLLVPAQSTDRTLDRFIPMRTKENLQAKFEAVSQNH